MARYFSKSALPLAHTERLADTFEEFVRRVRRGGLLFILIVAGLIVSNLLVHPLGLLLWIIALPLAGFASMLSMLWPTKGFRKARSVSPASTLPGVAASTLSRLTRSRSEMPRSSKAALDVVIHDLEALKSVGSEAHEPLLVEEAKRLSGQHLPRLVESFLALAENERTEDRIDALTDGLEAIGEELADLKRRLSASRTDRFEIERQFILNRFPKRGGLAGI